MNCSKNFNEYLSEANENGSDIERFSIKAHSYSGSKYITSMFAKAICQDALSQRPETKLSHALTASATSNCLNVRSGADMKGDPAKYTSFAKIVNTPYTEIKIRQKKHLDHNRALYSPLNNIMQALVHAYPGTRSVGLLLEERGSEEVRLRLSLLGCTFEDQLHISLNVYAKSLIQVVNFPFYCLLPDWYYQEMFLRGLPQRMPMSNDNSPSNGFGLLPLKPNLSNISEYKTKRKKRNNQASKPTHFHALQSESREEFMRENCLGLQRSPVTNKIELWDKFKDEFEIAPHANLAVSNNSEDSSQNYLEEYLPQEIKRCFNLPQNLPPDSAYGTYSKPTTDGMNEYYESYGQPLNQNYGNPQTERKLSVHYFPASSDPQIYVENENHITHPSQAATSGNSQNVLQIDPLFAKTLVNSGIPLTDLILDLPSNISGILRGAKKQEVENRARGFAVELKLQAKVKKLDEEFKDLHQTSSKETSGRDNSGRRHATHLITVDPDCYQRLHETRIRLSNNGLLQPQYARTVMAEDAAYLMDFLSRLKNNSVERHCGLVFSNEVGIPKHSLYDYICIT
jgi:hypothetical protein